MSIVPEIHGSRSIGKSFAKRVSADGLSQEPLVVDPKANTVNFVPGMEESNVRFIVGASRPTQFDNDSFQTNNLNLNDYTVLEKLANGGMAQVYKATAPDGKTVAIKLIRDTGTNVEVTTRFGKEAVTTMSLRHDHILPTLGYGYDEDHNIYFIVMEFADGGTFRDFMDSKMRVDPTEKKYKPMAGDNLSQALITIIPILDALDYIHSHPQGIIHRDIKPQNILIVNGVPKLGDFGIVSEVQGTQHMTRTGQQLGTAPYMAPEQALNSKKASELSDLYSIGCILYELVTGQPPFTGESAQEITQQHINNKVIEPNEINPKVDNELNQLIMDLLIKEPDERALRFDIPHARVSKAYVLRERLYGITYRLITGQNYSSDKPKKAAA